MKTLFSLLLIVVSFVCAIQAQTACPTTQVSGLILYQGSVGQANYKVFPKNFGSCTVITKPILILDGFDPSNSRTNGIDNTLYSFINKLPVLFIQQLQSLGYDVILVDFNDGATWIQRNAFACVEVIKQINAVKVGNEQLIIVGPSMGGLIARYALTYMEQNNIPHNTRLYVSFDAPHRGANVPLGLQYVINNISSIPLAPVIQLQQFLDSPAASQMLVYHLRSTSSQCPSPKPEHNSFYSELMSLNDNLGFPKLTRNISISNGMPNGYWWYVSGNMTYHNYEGTQANTQTFPNFPQGTLALDGDNAAFLSASLALQADVRNMPGGAFSWDIPEVPVAFTDGLLSRPSRVMIKTSCSKPYDIAPGGYSSFIDSIFKTISATTSGNISIRSGNSCFIPTISSLFSENDSLSYAYSRDMFGLSRTPFDAILTAPETWPSNEEHVQINFRNSSWLISQLTQTQRCLSKVETQKIINFPGANVAGCPNFMSSIPTLPAGYTVKWILSPNLQTASDTGRFLNATLRPGQNGSGFVEAQLTGPCGPVAPIRKDYAWLGVPPRIASMTRNTPFPANPMCAGGGRWVRFIIPSTPGAVDYHWIVRRSGVVLQDFYSTGLSLQLEPQEAGTYVVLAYARNACGESTQFVGNEVQVVTAHPNCRYRVPALSVSPNPVTRGQFTAELKPQTVSLPAASSNLTSSTAAYSAESQSIQLPDEFPKEYRLLDPSGATVRNGTFTGSQISVSTEGLRVGVYTLVVVVGDQAQRVKVVVQR